MFRKQCRRLSLVTDGKGKGRRGVVKYALQKAESFPSSEKHKSGQKGSFPKRYVRTTTFQTSWNTVFSFSVTKSTKYNPLVPSTDPKLAELSCIVLFKHESMPGVTTCAD